MSNAEKTWHRTEVFTCKKRSQLIRQTLTAPTRPPQEDIDYVLKSQLQEATTDLPCTTCEYQTECVLYKTINS